MRAEHRWDPAKPADMTTEQYAGQWMVSSSAAHQSETHRWLGQWIGRQVAYASEDSIQCYLHWLVMSRVVQGCKRIRESKQNALTDCAGSVHTCPGVRVSHMIKHNGQIVLVRPVVLGETCFKAFVVPGDTVFRGHQKCDSLVHSTCFCRSSAH